MLDSTVSLNEMEEKLEHILLNNKGKIRILADCQLSIEDYKILCLRLRGFAKYQKSIRLYQKYKLCLISVGVYAFQYEPDVEAAIEKVHNLFEKVPQYMQRRLFDICEVVLEEMGLTTYGIHIVDITTLEQALIIQAGISEEICQEIFKYCGSENEVTVNGMLIHVRWMNYEQKLDILDDILKRRLLENIIAAYTDCSKTDILLSELKEKYPELSHKFLGVCYYYCSMQKSGETENLKILVK